MGIFLSVIMAFKNIFSNKLRSLLTMLGIIIGIGSVIIITAIGAGSQAEINSQFDRLGAGRVEVSLTGSNPREADYLTMKDYEFLLAQGDVGIKYISPVFSARAELKLFNPKETKNVTLTGVAESYKHIESQELLYGRYINENDLIYRNRVCVIFDTTAEKVFGFSDPTVVGGRINVKTRNGPQKFTVIGVIKNANAALEAQYGFSLPENVFLPVQTLLKLFNTSRLGELSVIVDDPDVMDVTSRRITDMLNAKHRTKDRYAAMNMMNIMEQINSVVGTITLLISFVAGISLVVGGIGVMNIMLVTVTERTREIGVRKSIGAKNRDILTQFLIEAIILTGFGGALGLLLGYAGGRQVAALMGITAVVSPEAVATAVGISLFIGIVFGVYPARKASKLDPIEALRYE